VIEDDCDEFRYDGEPVGAVRGLAPDHVATIGADRRRTLIEALAEHAPAVELKGLAAGFHAVACLPERCDERAVIAAARERGVGLYPMSRYRTDGSRRPPQLVLGFGDVSETAIRRGIAQIGDLLDPGH
jgi:GntR family transcriptional regulator/MocR family aminotransferase